MNLNCFLSYRLKFFKEKWQKRGLKSWSVTLSLSSSYLNHSDSDEETSSSEEEGEKAEKGKEENIQEEKIQSLTISCFLNRWGYTPRTLF